MLFQGSRTGFGLSFLPLNRIKIAKACLNNVLTEYGDRVFPDFNSVTKLSSGFGSGSVSDSKKADSVQLYCMRLKGDRRKVCLI